MAKESIAQSKRFKCNLGVKRHNIYSTPERILDSTPSSLEQFRTIVHMAKQALPTVPVPICVMQGDRDEVVHPKSSEYVSGMCNRHIAKYTTFHAHAIICVWTWRPIS